MTRLLATTALIGAVLAAPAWAQTATPQTATPPAMPQTAAPPASPQAATQPPAAQLSARDRAFIRDAAEGGMTEVAQGKLAGQKGEAPAIKDFGRKMVDDHTKANERLGALAQQDGVTLPAAVSDAHRTADAALEHLSGSQFDRTYIHGAIKDHQQAVQLFERESRSGGNADLKAFATETLPTIKHHLAMAQTIAGDLRRNAQQAAAPGGAEESSGSSMAAPRGGDKSSDHSANQLNEQELHQLSHE